MAATDATPFAIKNQAYLVYFTINDSNGRPVASAGSLDSERSLDGAAFGDCTNEASEIGQGWYSLLLSATEMNTSCTLLVVKSDQEATFLSIYPVEDGDIRVDTVQIEGSDATDQINAAADAAIVTYGLDHLVSTSVTGTDVANNSIIAKLVDDAATADWDGYDSTTASLEALNVDTDAIKAETALIVSDTNELQTDNTPGTLSTIEGKIDTIDGIVDTILIDTDLIDDGTSGLAKIATDVAAVLVDTGTTLQAELDGIQADTEDIQSRLPAALVNSRMDSTIDATGMETGAVDNIWDEAMVETTGAPAVTGSFRAALQWMFGLSRNKITQTATTTTLRNDADGGDLATSTVSDDGTTYTRGEWST